MGATTMKVLGLLLVVAGWAVVLRGLYLLPVSDDPALDLDAGPAFALNVSVYLPAVALTLLLLLALPVATAARRGAAIGVAAAVAVSLFALWALTQQPLLDHVPGLASSLLLAAALGGAALVVSCAALVGRAGDGPDAADPERDEGRPPTPLGGTVRG